MTHGPVNPECRLRKINIQRKKLFSLIANEKCLSEPIKPDKVAKLKASLKSSDTKPNYGFLALLHEFIGRSKKDGHVLHSFLPFNYKIQLFSGTTTTVGSELLLAAVIWFYRRWQFLSKILYSGFMG